MGVLTMFSKRLNRNGEGAAEVRNGFIGKIPSRPDFVRHMAGNPEIKALDQWIQEGIAYLVRRFPADWRERLGSFASYRFYISGEGTPLSAVCGVIRASQDKSGRQHPFVSFVSCRSEAPADIVPFVPLQFDEFYHRADMLAGDDGVPYELDQLVSYSNGLTRYVRRPANGELAGRRAQSWQGIGIGRLWDGIMTGTSLTRRAAFARDLLQTLRMAANRGPQRTAWGVRFPLPAPEQRGSTVSFWLSLVSGMLRGSKWRPHIFWSPSGDGSAAALTVYFREPGASSFAQLISPECDEGGVVDLVRRPLDNMPEVNDARLLSLVQNSAMPLDEALRAWLAAGGIA